MSQLRINGLVRTADRIRRYLADGANLGQRTQMQSIASEGIEFVDGCIARHGATLDALPAPTRRAYAFLKSIDWAALPADAAGDKEVAQPTHSFGIRGLRSHWEHVLQRLARPIESAELRQVERQRLMGWREDLEKLLERDGLDERGLTGASAAILAWVRYFSEAAHFERYCTAIGTLAAVADPLLASSTRFSAPGRYEFCLARHGFDLRTDPNGTRIRLAIPLTALEPPRYAELAGMLLANADRTPLRSWLLQPACREVEAALHALVDQPVREAGAFHDLRAAFERVNRSYFSEPLPAPRLIWNRTLTGRKFGHYDVRRDTVMLSCSLDRPDVPALVVDFVMYHELLHKRLAVSESNGRCRAHTPEFRELERRFAGFEEADRWLQRLAQTEAIPCGS